MQVNLCTSSLINLCTNAQGQYINSATDKLLSMKIDKDCTMAVTNKEVEEMYKSSKKVMLRRSLPEDIVKYIGEMAFEDFGSMDRTAVAKELTKLVLTAKETQEKESK